MLSYSLQIDLGTGGEGALALNTGQNGPLETRFSEKLRCLYKGRTLNYQDTAQYSTFAPLGKARLIQ
jgi:hypothetical protein